MERTLSVLFVIGITTVLSSCAEMSAVMKSDASFAEKVKQLGGIVSKQFDTTSGTRTEAVNKYNYTGQDNLLAIDSASLSPAVAAPGTTVESVVQYTVLAPIASQQVKVLEVITLVSNTENIQLSTREVARDQGTLSTTLKFTLPKDLAKGNYMLVTSISIGKNAKAARSSLKVI